MPRRSKYIALLIALLLVLFAAGCQPDQAATAPPAPVKAPEQHPSPPAPATMSVTVYFATKDASFLVPETRILPKNDHPIRTAIEQLLGEPKNAALVRALPEGTKLKGITVKDHIAYVDFNDKLIKNGSGGSAGELLAVGAIVNTLTEFADIEQVQIMVEGKKVNTLYGHVDTSEPLSRSEKIVKKTL
ncbi:GerMN domain-containing protein [Anaeroselena agilis]|uniref:GerMN domain-containing protein n=1 Tax=Anaeroselena agilis TaxID=3063788 RepID=A0ABU3NT69_9FIRM|nr:GerMN domain-containing protein [Selenomonadales bacterium 4137-cl]